MPGLVKWVNSHSKYGFTLLQIPEKYELKLNRDWPWLTVLEKYKKILNRD